MGKAGTSGKPKLIPRKQRVAKPATKAYRQYTDAERAEAVALLMVNGLNIQKTADELGIPRATLKNWVRDGVRPPKPEAVIAVAVKTEEKLEAFLDRVLAIDFEKLEKGTLLEQAQAAALIVEKICALRGHAGSVYGLQATHANLNLNVGNKEAGHLTNLNPLEVNELSKLMDKLTGRAGVVYTPRPGDPDYDPGLDEPIDIPTPAESKP